VAQPAKNNKERVVAKLFVLIELLLSDLLNITQSSPSKGTIRIVFNPTQELQVGDDRFH
jgi:hypothetical protein